MYHKRINEFPKDFLFGAATSAFQAEGGVNEGGRGTAIHDLAVTPKGITDFSVASDHYHRYEEDISLMQELGLDAYRFSMSWTRIMPDGKNVNQEGIAFYNKLLQTVVEKGMVPIVTIYHFEYPQALIDRYEGWVSRESIEDYVHFARVLFENFGDRVKHWLTINEQDHLLKIPERLGFAKDMDTLTYERKAQTANYHMCIATAKAIALCHQMHPDAKIGPVVNPMPGIPAGNKPEDLIAAMEFDELSTYYILDIHCRGQYSPLYWKYLCDRGIEPEIQEEDMQLIKKNPPDFIGINYYMNQTIAASSTQAIDLHGKGFFIREEAGIYKIVENEHIPQTDWGWNICPEGMKITIMDMYHRYQLPVLITENGLGAYDKLVDDAIEDDYRIEYLKNHLSQIKDCIGMGYPVIGYCAWSFLDLVSGREGMDKRYGFVYVNRDNKDLKDCRRIKKNSFYWYQKVIANRGKGL